jgi:UDPglucose 6-dehydrogenase
VSKSTVPVGTARRVRAMIARQYAGEFDVASNPEFLREGHAIEDFMKPDRIVIGTETERARETLARLYQDFPSQKIFTDIESAELTKYASNAFLATKISFINEMASLCESARVFCARVLATAVRVFRKTSGRSPR